MLGKIIAQDILKLVILLGGCLAIGLALNQLRARPLSLVSTSSPAVAASGEVSLEEMKDLTAHHAALILDARPEIFFRLGHIPSASNLPRDDFDKQYAALQSSLESRRDNMLVVYCSTYGCEDSQMVADELRERGYAHVRLFRGGWSDWQADHLPEEKK